MNSDPREIQQELHQAREANRISQEELSTLRRFIKSLQSLVDTADRLYSAQESINILEQILRDALQAVEAEDGSLLVLDEDTGELVFVLALGNLPAEKLVGLRLAPGQGIAGWVAEHREPTVVQNPHADKRFYGGLDDTFQFHTHSIMAAPVMGGGRLLGVIEVLNKEVRKAFTADDLALLMLLCRFAGELLFNLESGVIKKKTG